MQSFLYLAFGAVYVFIAVSDGCKSWFLLRRKGVMNGDSKVSQMCTGSFYKAGHSFDCIIEGIDLRVLNHTRFMLAHAESGAVRKERWDW